MSADFTNFDPNVGYAAERIKTHCCPVTPTGEQRLNEAVEDVQYWKERCQFLINTIDLQCDDINDLQADYAGDIQSWRNVYHTNEQVNDETHQEQVDHIEQLETTIRVLSGMINE